MSPLSLPMRALIAVVLCLACAGFGYYAGDHNRNNAWLAQQGVAERQAKEALQAATARGDTLSGQLLRQEDQIIQLKTEKLHAIALSTTGRPCLSGATLRLLNQTPGLSVQGLPPATSGVVAANEPVASDTNIAQWAADAGAQFEVCRARLNTLIEWHTP